MKDKTRQPWLLGWNILKVYSVFSFLILLLACSITIVQAEEIEEEDPLRQEIIQALEENETITLDLFVMSHCPYAIEAEKKLIPIVREFEDRIDFCLNFIAHEDENGNIISMHGEEEVKENMRQLMIDTHYPEKLSDYLLGNYKYDKKTIHKDYIYEALRNNISVVKEDSINVSPTIKINNKIIINNRGCVGSTCDLNDENNDPDELHLDCTQHGIINYCVGDNSIRTVNCNNFQCINGICVDPGNNVQDNNCPPNTFCEEGECIPDPIVCCKMNAGCAMIKRSQCRGQINQNKICDDGNCICPPERTCGANCCTLKEMCCNGQCYDPLIQRCCGGVLKPIDECCDCPRLPNPNGKNSSCNECIDGECVLIDCDDGDPCTDDYCAIDGSGCINEPINTPSCLGCCLIDSTSCQSPITEAACNDLGGTWDQGSECTELDDGGAECFGADNNTGQSNNARSSNICNYILNTYNATTGRWWGVRSFDNIYTSNTSYLISRRNADNRYYDIFTSLYDQNGQQLWTRTLGSYDYDAVGYDVKMDMMNNVVAIGLVEGGDIYLDGDANPTFADVGNKRQMVLLKYDITGNLVWAKEAGGPGWDGGLSLVITDNNDIITTGYMQSGAIFDNITLPNTSGDDVFLAKYDENGNVLWAKIVAWGPGHDNGLNIDLDSQGNIIVTGYFHQTLSFDVNTTFTAMDATDGFVAKFDPNGNFIWAKHISGLGYEGSVTAKKGMSVVVDNVDDIVIGGEFQQSIIFDNNTTFNAPYTPSNGNNEKLDAFVAKYDANGNFLWARHGADSNEREGRTKSVTVDGCNNILVIGEFQGDIIWDGDPVMNSIGSRDVFRLKLDPNGSTIWSRVEGGTAADYGMDIFNDWKGRTITVGCFYGTSTFSGATATSDLGKADMYVAYEYEAIPLVCLGNDMLSICQGESIEINNFENNPAITYTWLDGTNGYTRNVSPNITTTYTLIASNNEGCEKVGEITVEVNPLPDLNIDPPADLTCATTSLQLLASVDVNTVVYDWTTNDGNILNGQSTATPTINQAGTYSLEVLNTLTGCMTSEQVVVTEAPDVLAITDVSTNESCANALDASIDLSVGGGVAPYTYAWSNGDNTEDLASISSGTYVVTVTDVNGCVFSHTIEVEGNPELLASIQGEDTNCANESTGTATTSVTGGSGNYNYLWNTGATTPTIDNLAEGTYTVTITDDNDCIVVQTVMVEEPSAMAVAAITSTPGGSNPFDYYNSYTIEIEGGTPPYYYTWHTVGYVRNSITGLGEISVVYADESTWSVTVTDANGCLYDENGDLLVFSNNQNANVLLDIDSHNIVAHTFSGLGSIDIVPTGGTPPYQYSWSGPATWNGTGQGTANISNCAYGWYTIVITDNSIPSQATTEWYFVPRSRSGGRGKLAEETFTLFPNPTQQTFTINFSTVEATELTIEVVDAKGRVIQKQYSQALPNGEHTFEIDLGDAAVGVYFVKVTTTQGSYLEKVLKVK